MTDEMKPTLILSVLLLMAKTAVGLSIIPNQSSLLVCLDLSQGEFVWSRNVGFSDSASVDLFGDFVRVSERSQIKDGAPKVRWVKADSGEPVKVGDQVDLMPVGMHFPRPASDDAWPLEGLHRSAASLGDQVLVSSRREGSNRGRLSLFIRGESSPRWTLDLNTQKLPRSRSRSIGWVEGTFGAKYVYAYSAGYLWALDKSSGKILRGVDTTKKWSYLSYAGDEAYLIPYKDSIVVVNGCVLFAMNAELNRVLWMKLMHREPWGYPYSVMHDDRLYFLKPYSPGIGSLDKDWRLRITR